MRTPSPLTASFREGHSMKQAPYTDWKASLLEPFTSTVRDRTVKGRFQERCLTTTTCLQLRPFYDLFYPLPARKKVFPASLPDLMTPFVLAVWYMDDGNLTKRSEPRIAFGLDSVSLKRALKALLRLGLRPKVYGEGSDQAIHFPKQRMDFRALVEPYLIPCMQYKLPTETERQAGDRNARKLTPEKAASLYLGGMSVVEIGKAFGAGVSTVNRRLKTAGVKKRRSGPRFAKHTVESADVLLRDPGALTEEEILRVLQGTPFPFLTPYAAENALVDLGKVTKAEMGGEGGLVGPVRSVGVKCCASFFPNRYSARSKWSKLTAFEAWHDEKELRRAVVFQVKAGDPVRPSRVLKAITMNCRTPSVFRPTVARFIYETFCKPGDRVWDPCAGYGGRLMGAAAAGVHYVGTDVEPETVKGNRALADALGYTCEVHCVPAQDFDPPPVSLVFTSPPYFDQEQYQGGQQSWKDFGELGAWVEGFLRPLLRTSHRVLLDGGHLVLNIADVRDRKGEVFPLVAKAVEVAEEEGFVLDAQWEMKLPNLNRKKTEPLLIFKKPAPHT